MILPFVREAFAELEQSGAFDRVQRHLSLGAGRRRVSGLTATARSLYIPLMARAAILFGVLLIILGLVGYFSPTTLGDVGEKGVSPTALIPAGVGAILLLCGLIVEFKPTTRKHVMHLAAAVGLIGALGGITGALIGMGIPEYEAKRYEGRVRKGGILLSVHADDSAWTDRAKKILMRTGAEDIASAGEAKGDFANTAKPMPR